MNCLICKNNILKVVNAHGECCNINWYNNFIQFSRFLNKNQYYFMYIFDTKTLSFARGNSGKNCIIENINIDFNNLDVNLSSLVKLIASHNYKYDKK